MLTMICPQKVGQKPTNKGADFMTKYNEIFKLDVIHFYFKYHQSIPQTSQHFNLHKSIVEKWVAQYQHLGVQGLEVKRTHKSYSAAEKYAIILPVLSGKLSATQAAILANISSKSVICQWLKRFQKQGIIGLEDKSRGRKAMKPSTNRRVKKTKEPQTELERLRERNLYLEAENAYLKKLAELDKIEKRRKSSVS